jgi:hypothetical protein
MPRSSKKQESSPPEPEPVLEMHTHTHAHTPDVAALVLEGLRLRRGGLMCAVESLAPALRAMVAGHVPEHALAGKVERDGAIDSWHITLASPQEVRQLCGAACTTPTTGGGGEGKAVAKHAAEALLADAVRCIQQAGRRDVRVLGIGTAQRAPSQCWFLVLEWEAAAAWRAEKGLPPHDFHATVGIDGADVHGITKDATTLLEAVEPEPESEPNLLAPLVARLVTPARLAEHLRVQTGDTVVILHSPAGMRALLRSFRCSVVADLQRELQHRQKHSQRHSTDKLESAYLLLLGAAPGSAPARMLTDAAKKVVADWMTGDSASARGVGLIRTLSAQARAEAELARAAERVATKETAALVEELAEAEQAIAQYQQQQEYRHQRQTSRRQGPPKKLLVCVRHGHSLAQGVTNRVRKTDPNLLDAKLSRTGHSQAQDLGRMMRMQQQQHVGVTELQRAELVVVSPLTRALQTACTIFERGPTVPIICHPDVAEVGGGIPENRARALSVLGRDTQLSSMQIFASVDFSLLSPAWPPQGGRPPLRSNSVRKLPSRFGPPEAAVSGSQGYTLYKIPMEFSSWDPD